MAGASFTLTAIVAGLTNGLYFQWQQAGTNIPGANSLAFTNPAATYAAAGSYDLIVTNLYGSATSGVAQVSILAPTLWVWKGNVNGTWNIATRQIGPPTAWLRNMPMAAWCSLTTRLPRRW